MGHLGHIKKAYQQLVTRLESGTCGLPEPADPSAWKGWKEILEILYTPEEAAIACHIPVKPASLEVVAKRVGIEPGELKPKLEQMCDKGVVMDLVDPNNGAAKYLLSPPVVGFFEFSMMRAHDMFPKQRVAEALEAYINGDPAFTMELYGYETVIGRALPHEAGLAATELPTILSWERASEVVDKARVVATSLCFCRHKAEHLGKACSAPQEICLSLNSAADFITRRNFGRAIEKKEAHELLAQAQKAGLVQIADNVKTRPIFICNCCSCCCDQLRSINEHGLRGVNPSGFQPAHDDVACRGCSRCARACPVGAISMAPKRVPGQQKNQLQPSIERRICIGCGVCTSACKRGAMCMVRREEQPDVPETGLERTLRMTKERGCRKNPW